MALGKDKIKAFKFEQAVLVGNKVIITRRTHVIGI